MDLDRLCALIEAYGAAPRRWPAAERDTALALLAKSAEARALADSAADLDRRLDVAPAAVPGPGLAMRVVAHAPKPRGRVWRPFPSLWPAAATLVAAVVLGVALGALAPAALDDPLSEAEVAVLAFGPSVAMEDSP